MVLSKTKVPRCLQLLPLFPLAPLRGKSRLRSCDIQSAVALCALRRTATPRVAKRAANRDAGISKGNQARRAKGISCIGRSLAPPNHRRTARLLARFVRFVGFDRSGRAAGRASAVTAPNPTRASTSCPGRSSSPGSADDE